MTPDPNKSTRRFYLAGIAAMNALLAYVAFSMSAHPASQVLVVLAAVFTTLVILGSSKSDVAGLLVAPGVCVAVLDVWIESRIQPVVAVLVGSAVLAAELATVPRRFTGPEPISGERVATHVTAGFARAALATVPVIIAVAIA